MQQIDWSKAPHDATHAGQDDLHFSFYKDINGSGCKFWHVGKNNSDISGPCWSSTRDQPNATPIFERPSSQCVTVRVKLEGPPTDADMLNRNQALEWCVKNLNNWATSIHGHKAPDGWTWVSLCGAIWLQGADPLHTVTKKEWLDLRERGIAIAPQVPTDPDRLNLIETMKKRSIDSWSSGGPFEAPSGWQWDTAVGMHPHCDQLVRLSDGDVIKFVDVYGMQGVFAQQPPQQPPPMSNREYNDASGLSARLTLERLGYEWEGGELWKPPLGKVPEYIEFDDWNVGDECWVSNEKGYGLTDYNRELLGFDTMSTIVSLFVTPKGTKMATVNHVSGDCICWALDMLKRPLSKRDKVIKIISSCDLYGTLDGAAGEVADEIIKLLGGCHG